MSRLELAEHWSYWRDDVKIESYQAALAATVMPDSVVLDLGCGTGLLGLLACEAGAKRVYAVDAGGILEVAKEIAAASPFADRIIHIKDLSTRIELPERANVVVADQIGGLAFDAGTNDYFSDARARLATEDAVYIPGRFTLRLAPVSAPAEADELRFWRSSPRGIDLAALSGVAVNCVRQVYEKSTASYLGAGVDIAEMASWDASPIDAKATIHIDRSGTLHGLLGTFVAEMAPGVIMTNDPSVAQPMRERWQDLLVVGADVEVERDDVVDVSLLANPTSYQVTWRVTVRRGATTIHSSLHSTALGTFFGADDLGAPLDAPPRRLQAWQWALEAIGGGASQKDLETQAVDRFPELFAEARAGKHFADEVWSAVQ